MEMQFFRYWVKHAKFWWREKNGKIYFEKLLTNLKWKVKFKDLCIQNIADYNFSIKTASNILCDSFFQLFSQKKKKLLFYNYLTEGFSENAFVWKLSKKRGVLIFDDLKSWP